MNERLNLLPDRAEHYFNSQIQKLGRKREEVGCAPTRHDLQRIMLEVRLWDVEQYQEEGKSLLVELSQHRVNLVELVTSIFGGHHWRMKIKRTSDELTAARKALKMAKRRSRMRGTGLEDMGVLRCSLRVKEMAATFHRAMFTPGINRTNNLRGKRQDVPTKMAHLNIQRYFLSKHPTLSSLKRSDLTQRLLDATGSATGLYRPSPDAFHMREKRLQKQSRFLPRS